MKSSEAGWDRIRTLIRKGAALTAADVRSIELELAMMPLDAAREAEPWIWEGVGLIVADPDYRGDARLP